MLHESTEPHYIQSLRQPRVEGFKWVSPQDELDERIYREVITDGCSILSFGSSPTSPEFTYSVGLYLNFLHPEVLLMGLHPSTAQEIIAKIRDEAAQGLMLTSDSVRHDLFSDGRPVRFRAVPQDRYLDYLSRNCNLYFSLFLRDSTLHDFGFPVLQGIWPDKGGHFPDDPDCDARFIGVHTLISQP
jgi:hypothetical protein